MREMTVRISELAKKMDAAFSKTVTGLFDAVSRVARTLSDAFLKIVDYQKRLFAALFELVVAVGKLSLLFIPTLILWGFAAFLGSVSFWLAGAGWPRSFWSFWSFTGRRTPAHDPAHLHVIGGFCSRSVKTPENGHG